MMQLLRLMAISPGRGEGKQMCSFAGASLAYARWGGRAGWSMIDVRDAKLL